MASLAVFKQLFNSGNDGKHGQTDPVRTVQIDPFKTVETDPVKTEQTDPPLGLDIKVAFGRFLGNRILLA